MNKTTIEFGYNELNNLAAFIAALQVQGVRFTLRKDNVAIAVTI